MTLRIEAHDEVLAVLLEAHEEVRAPDDATRAHLLDCAGCANTFATLIATSDRLVGAGRNLSLDVEPPAALRERTRRAAVTADGSDRRSEPEAHGRAGVLVRLGWMIGGAAAGAVLAAAAIGVGMPLIGSGPAQTFALVGGDAAPNLDAAVIVHATDAGTRMRLTAANLPASAPGEFYELWWVGAEKRHLACGTFRSDGSQLDLAFTSAADLGETVLMEITIERDDGDPAPAGHIAQSRPASAGPSWHPAP